MTGSPVQAQRTVSAPPGRVVEFLRHIDNHFALTGARIQLLDPDGDRGGRVRIAGPLGLSRTARTRVTDVRADAVEGEARVGTGTRARVCWAIAPAGANDSRVTLSAQLVCAGGLDRLLLAVGGRAWLRRCFAQALERLDATLSG